LMGSTTRIDRALRLTQSEMFTEENGARPDVPNLLILLTDGTQSVDRNTEDPGDIAAELRQAGINMIVVGIGPGTNETELNHMAGGADNAFSAASFADLATEDFLMKLQAKTCQEAKRPADGNWGSWSDYNACPVSCGGGQQSRSRLCDSPPAMNGGRGCLMSDTPAGSGGWGDIEIVTQNCNENPCPVDGIWNDWSDFTQCPVSCGGGDQSRSRSCDNPAPANGGKKCVSGISGERVEEEEESRRCNEAACPVRPKCKTIVDVGFILDSSGSLRDDYQNEKNFLKEIAGAFGVSDDGSRSAVVTFSYYSEHSIKFKDHKDISSFNAAVDAIPLMGSTTRIDRALRQTQDEMFTEENGARPGIPKLLILLTDGTQSIDKNTEDPADIAVELRAVGINMIVVGIGPGTNETELTHMAGGAGNVFRAASFDDLTGEEFLTELHAKTCESAIVPPGPLQAPCKAIVDLGFILDSSGSLRDDYQNEKNFLKSIAEGFSISESGTHASVITFSYFSEHSIRFSDHKDITTFNAAVDAIPLMGSTTRIDKAFRLVQKEMFLTHNGARAAVPKMVILLTDGTQTADRGAEDPGDIAAEIRQSGINLIVVGIGPGTNKTELIHMAGSPDNAYIASSFQELSGNFAAQLNKRACELAKKPIQETLPLCEITKMDAVFAIDMSTDSEPHHANQKQMLNDLTRAISKSGQYNDIALVSYASDAKVAVPFRKQFDFAQFSSAVGDLQPMDNGRQADKAIVEAYNKLFKPRHSSSGEIITSKRNKLFVLFTAGKQGDKSATILPTEAARLLVDLGVHIVVVAFDETDAKVTDIASTGDDLYKIYRGDKLTNVWEKICKKFKPDVGPIDIGFLIDSTASMKKDFQKELEFVSKLASQYNLSPDGNHASAIVYSNRPKIFITLKEGTNINRFNDQLKNAPFLGKDTHFDRGLLSAHQALFDPKNGGRPRAAKLLFVFTDGRQSNPTSGSSVADVADALKRAGTHISVIAIGKATDREELKKIASTEKCVHYVEEVRDLLKDADHTIKMIQEQSKPHLGPSMPFTGPLSPSGEETSPSTAPSGEGARPRGPIMVCPLDKDIQSMRMMMAFGIGAEWTAKYHYKTGALKSMMKYHKVLSGLMSKLSPYISNLDSSLAKQKLPSSTGGCQSSIVEAAVAKVFSDDKAALAPDLYTTIRVNNGGYFADLLMASGLWSEIHGNGKSHTLIVPSNESYKKISKSVQEKMKNKCFLRNHLQHHIINGKFPLNDQPGQSFNLKSINGKEMSFVGNDDKFEVNGVQLTKVNISGTAQHVIHMIDEPIINATEQY